MKYLVRPILLILLLFSLINYSKAQNALIEGQVSSAQGPLAYANIILKSALDSTMLKAAVSDENGEYRLFATINKSYFLEISFLGLSTKRSEDFLLRDAVYKMLPIFLEENIAEMDEVEVVAKRPMIEVLADKTVFNVENTLNATGTNGFELLRKAPGVIVDNNNSIILDGKTGVQIYINGKQTILSGQDLVNYLSALQSSGIAAIELITQPSSRYDAAGNAGIINIRLKKDKRFGTNGTLTSGIAHGQNTRYNNSLSFNSRNAKTNLFGTMSNTTGTTWNFIYLDRIQQGVRYNSESETLSDQLATNIKLGLDYSPKTNHTVGFLVNANLFENDDKGFTNTPISPVSTGEVEQILIANSITENDNQFFNGNVNYRFADTSGHEFLVDFDLGRYTRDRNNYQPNFYQTPIDNRVLLERNFRMITPTDIRILTAKVDYSSPFLSGMLHLGFKYSNIETDNIFDFFDVVDGADFRNLDRSNQFIYNETINAAYINFNKKWGKWNIQAGLRTEQTISEGNLISKQQSPEDQVERNYLDWFPSGGLTFSPSFKSSWALNYSRRIQRPNYQTLNPFESQLDELSFAKGNPFLRPQYTTNIKLSNTYKYRLTTSLSYSRINDFFAQITDTLGTDRNFLITRNIANQEVWNLGISYPFELKKWWNVYISINASHASYEGKDDKFVAVDQSTLSFYAQNSFSLPMGWRFEVSGWYNSPSVWGGTYLTKSMGSLDIALQKQFFKDRLSARLSVSDLLFTSPWVADMRFGDLYINGTGGWESRQVRLNLSYTFGNQQVKKSRNRSAGSIEESKRIG